MKKSFYKLGTRLLALLLTAVTMIGLFVGVPIHANAESTSASNSISSVSVNSTSMYVVKKKTDLRSSTNMIYSKHGVLEKDTLVEGVGCSRDGKFIMVKVSDKTWWVKLSDLRKANKTTKD